MSKYRYYLFKADDKGNIAGVVRANPDTMSFDYWGRGASEWREDPSLLPHVSGDDSRDTVYVDEETALELVEKLRNMPRPPWVKW